jgi:hypothetical protein
MLLQTYFDRRTLLKQGVILLSRCLPSSWVIGLHEAAVQIFNQRLAPDGSLPRTENRAEARKLSYIAVSDVIGATPNLSLINRRIVTLAHAYLGHEPTVDSNSFVRCMVPGPNVQELQFHQDQAVLNRPLLNIWVPLDPCGVTAPGLEVIRIHCPDLLEPGGDATALIPVERVRLDESLVLKRFGRGALWHPALVPGDALIFPGTTVHRSYVTAEMTERRLSVELRLV